MFRLAQPARLVSRQRHLKCSEAVLTGAGRRPAIADGLLARASAILSRGFPGVMRLEANGLYKVQAGPFATPAAAERLALAYQQDFGVKPYKISR